MDTNGVSFHNRAVTKRLLIILGKYVLGLGLLAWVIWQHWEAPAGSGGVGLGDALQKPIHWGPLALAALFCVSSVLLTFLRWFILVRAQGLSFTPSNALRLGMVGFYFNTFLPGSVGGDIIKAACIAREQSRRTVAVATVLIDRGVGLCGLFWLAAVLGGAFWLSGELDALATTPIAEWFLKTVVLGAAGIVTGSLIFWFVLGAFSAERSARLADWLERFPKIGHSLAELWRAVRMYRSQGRSVALALGMSMVSHSGFVLTFYFAAQTLSPANQIPSLWAHFLIVPIGATIRAGFPAPGGVGGGEYGYGLLYEWLDAASAAGILGLLVQRCIECVWGLIGYIVYLRMKPSLPVATTTQGAFSGELTGDRCMPVQRSTIGSPRSESLDSRRASA